MYEKWADAACSVACMQLCHPANYSRFESAHLSHSDSIRKRRLRESHGAGLNVADDAAVHLNQW